VIEWLIGPSNQFFGPMPPLPYAWCLCVATLIVVFEL
jgi:hypothetical protein